MRLLKRLVPSPAMIVALLALFVATSGGAYAMATLGAKTVGTKQLKNGAVTTAKLHDSAVNSAKVLDGSLGARDFAPGQLQASLGSLAAGRTETGAFAVGGPAYITDSSFFSVETFPIPLRTGLAADHVIYVTGASVTHCPGRGHADRGYLCLYETTSNTPANPTIVDPTSNTGSAGASREGFLLTFNSAGINPSVSAWGTWAVTG